MATSNRPIQAPSDGSQALARPAGEPAGEILLYRTEDGRTRVECRFADETLWLTQALMAELFQTTPQNITQHLRALYREGEIERATCKEYLQVREEGNRQVRRSVKHYNLDAILAVGYRVRSARGTQFRRWSPSAAGAGSSRENADIVCDFHPELVALRIPDLGRQS